MKFTKELIKKAWSIRKEAATKFDCKVSEISWKECLVIAAQKVKKIERHVEYIKMKILFLDNILRG